MKFDKQSKHAAIIVVMDIKGLTRDFTGMPPNSLAKFTYYPVKTSVPSGKAICI
jgi:hypothetical protein